MEEEFISDAWYDAKSSKCWLTMQMMVCMPMYTTHQISDVVAKKICASYAHVLLSNKWVTVIQLQEKNVDSFLTWASGTLQHIFLILI